MHSASFFSPKQMAKEIHHVYEMGLKSQDCMGVGMLWFGLIIFIKFNQTKSLKLLVKLVDKLQNADMLKA